jgi:hypothetical protein
MNGFNLKLIAMITMFIDHMAAILLPWDSKAWLICRSIGRLAFPIFCFLLVEGFLHTHNVRKYMARLGIFALISEIPFDLAFTSGSIHSGFLHQNVFFTLFIGLALIYGMSIISLVFAKNIILGKLLQGILILAGCFAAYQLKTDYAYMGVLMIVAFYVFRKSKLLLTLAVFFVNTMFGLGIQILGAFSMMFILFYNGKRGHQGNKYLFYIFYPAHIFILYLISRLPVF